MSDDQRHGLTLIAFVGSVFSPYYAWARRRGQANPEDHCALNVALYSPGAGRWCMTERGQRHCSRSAREFVIGPSRLHWDGQCLQIEIDERGAPLPRRVRGRVRLWPGQLQRYSTPIEPTGRHRWGPIAPHARIEVDLPEPGLHWQGHAYLDSNEGGARVVSPWARNLEKLGIKLNFRAVDFALYQQRLQKFDFDITTIAYGGTHSPGQEYADLFGSKAAVTEDSGNLTGMSSPAVDALIVRMVAAKTRAELLPACRALERVIAHSHVLVPQWSAPTHRMVYNQQRLSRPPQMPPYVTGEIWAVFTWWSR
jgi:hypothetical protein